MRINKLSSINFGHSAKSQALIDKYCDRNLTSVSRNAYQKASECCNSLEEMIYRREKKYGYTSVPPDLTDLYLEIKQAFLDNIVVSMPNYDKLIESEYQYYKDSLESTNLEGKAKKDNWRNQILDFLRGWDRDLGLTPEEIEERDRKIQEEQENKKNEGLPPILKNLFMNPPGMFGSSASAPSVKLSLIEETPYSPKGFDDLVGSEDIKKRLKDRIIDPVKDPKKAEKDFVEYGKTRANSLMLYGPPGCGKTFLVEALAKELNTYAFSIDVGKLGSKYINQTSVNIQQAFDAAAEIAQKDKSRPIILFLDEIDALAAKRSSSLNQESTKDLTTLLKCIVEARSKNILVIGASNRPDMMDEAFIDRFEMKEYIALPTKDQIVAYLKKDLSKKTKGQKLLSNPDELEQIANLTKGYTFRSLSAIVKNAADNACERGDDIGIEDYKKAVEESSETAIKEENYKTRKNKKPMGFAL